MTKSQVNKLGDQIRAAGADVFAETLLVDRRENPKHGYRAVHVVAGVEGHPVEIQVRTEIQDRWAQAMERLADKVGRGIRYGEKPRDPVAAAQVDRLMEISTLTADVEALAEKSRNIAQQHSEALAGMKAKVEALEPLVHGLQGKPGHKKMVAELLALRETHSRLEATMRREAEERQSECTGFLKRISTILRQEEA